MPKADPKYPVPDRSDHVPNARTEDPELPEIDMKQEHWVMPDGRPAVVEEWLDFSYRLILRTFFYSTLDIEDWTDAQHYAYIESANGLVGKTVDSEDIGKTEVTDPSGNTLFSITIVIVKLEE